MNIGIRIRTVRKYKNLTLKELGDLAGIHFVRLGKFERGIEKPTQEILKRIEKALNIKFENILMIDEQIESLFSDFINSCFYHFDDFHSFIKIINENRELFQASAHYSKILIIEYTIAVLQKQTDTIDQLEILLEQYIEVGTREYIFYNEYKAVKYHQQRNVASALGYMNKSLTSFHCDKMTAMAYYHASFIYKDIFMYDEASAALTKAKNILTNHSSYRRAFYCDLQFASIYVRRKQYENSIRLYDSCIESSRILILNDSIYSRIVRNKAWAYLLMKEYDLCLNTLETIKQIDDNQLITTLYKSWCYYFTKKFNTAKKTIESNFQFINDEKYGKEFQLLLELTNIYDEKPTKRVIKFAESLYDSYNLAQRSEDTVFVLNLLINLLTRRNDTEKLIKYLKISI